MENLFRPLANDERYPDPANSPVDIANRPEKAPIKRTTPGQCDSDNKPMDADSTAHRK